MIETKFVTYTDDAELLPMGQAGWTIFAVVSVCGVSGVYLRRVIQPAGVALAVPVAA